MKAIERLFELQQLETGPKAGSAGIKKARAEIRKEIPPTILAHYDRLMARGKKGVALVRNAVCSGCRMKLASGIYAALVRDEDIAMCDNCARYLMVDPEPEPEPEVKKPAKKTTASRRRKKTEPEPEQETEQETE